MRLVVTRRRSSLARVGATFALLDPAAPAALIASMLAESGASWALSLEGTPLGRLAPFHDASVRLFAIQPAPPLAPFADERYVVFTSGSTGAPKRVRVSGGAIDSNVAALARRLGVTAASVVAQLTPPAFDPAVVDVMLCAATGATLLLLDEAVKVRS